MKNLSAFLFSVAMIFPAAMSIMPVGAQTPAASPASDQRRAVIVIRHAEDAEDWVGNARTATSGQPDPAPGEPYPFPSKVWQGEGQSPNWPQLDYTFTEIDDQGEHGLSHESLLIQYHGLSGKWFKDGKDGTRMKGKEEPFGEDQAVSLAEALDAFPPQGKFAKIDRVITMDPRQEGSTPNPFDTLWPYVKKGEGHTSLGQPLGAELLLVNRNTSDGDKWPGLMAMIAKDKLLKNDGSGSTIICWTGEGINGPGGILDTLVTKYRGEKKNYRWINDKAVRCSDLFVFYHDADGMGVVEKWKFDWKTGKFENIPKANW